MRDKTCGAEEGVDQGVRPQQSRKGCDDRSQTGRTEARPGEPGEPRWPPLQTCWGEESFRPGLGLETREPTSYKSPGGLGGQGQRRGHSLAEESRGH